MKEKDSHAAAFEAYYEMGPSRSLTRLSARLGISRSTLRNWSTAFRWRNQVEERNRDVAKVIAARSMQTEVEERGKQRQLVQLALVTVARQMAEGKIKATLADLDRLIRLESFLVGEADSRHELVARDLRAKSPEELRELLRREVAELAELSGGDIAVAELATPVPESATDGPQPGVEGELV